VIGLPEPRRIRPWIVGALYSVLLLGCAKEKGSTYTCACTFLTDFDDGSSHDVTVCSPSDERAPNFARGCAQSAAPAPVEKCSCRVEKKDSGCEVGLCQNKPREP
jgi:hypothetical protein